MLYPLGSLGWWSHPLSPEQWGLCPLKPRRWLHSRKLRRWPHLLKLRKTLPNLQGLVSCGPVVSGTAAGLWIAFKVSLHFPWRMTHVCSWIDISLFPAHGIPEVWEPSFISSCLSFSQSWQCFLWYKFLKNLVGLLSNSWESKLSDRSPPQSFPA